MKKTNTPRLFPRPLLHGAAALAALLAVPVSAAVPERSAGGQALAVPPAQLDLGQVYHVVTGGDTQVTVTSSAALQRVVAGTSRTVGYLVAPFDLEEKGPPVLAGAFRVPVASLRTGAAEIDEQLLGEGFLDAANHPEITFEVTGLKDLEASPPAEDAFAFRGRLAGELGVKGAVHEVELPVELRFQLSNFSTFRRSMGDLLTLAGSFEINPSALGWEPPRYRGQLAESLSVDLFLVFSVIDPDRTLDPGSTQERFRGESRFVTLLRDLEDPEAAYAHGRAHMKTYWEDAAALEALLRLTLETPGVEPSLPFAHEVARRVAELTSEEDSELLATLARLRTEMGDPEGAAAWQAKAEAEK